MTDSIARLRTAGVSVWLDDLSREQLTTRSLAALRDRGVSGVTTNPTIFARAISDSDAYNGQIRDLKLRQMPVDQALRELTASDVRRACDVLRPAYEATGGVDGRVPYFYTDQYDLGMEYAGYAGPGGYDRVVFRGDTGKREFIAFWLSGVRVVAGMNVNIWDINDAIQNLVRSSQAVDPARLADPAVPLDEVAATHDRRSS